MGNIKNSSLWVSTLTISFLTLGISYKILSNRLKNPDNNLKSRNKFSQEFTREKIPTRKKELEYEYIPENQANSEIDLDNIKTKRRQLWSSLQPKLKDTVVQVFAQITEFDWLEPYKTPSQGEVRGSAFFINGEGELITNAHVVDQASVVFIQIPSFGKRRFEVSVIGVSPDRDLALLKLKDDDALFIKKALNKESIPHLELGNSDTIMRADKIMALGFPLGQQGLKSTTGVVSGHEHIGGQHYIQISAPINKGNSGGPSLNDKGEAIGVNSAGIPDAQSVGYVIPMKEVELFYDQIRNMPDLPNGETKLLRKPFLGVLFHNANDKLTDFLGNPQPGGLYVADIYKGSPLYKAGIKAGDMLYKINNYDVDVYGELNVPWLQEDKISIMDFISRLKTGEEIVIDFYDKGVPKVARVKFGNDELMPIRRVYPGYEKIDYEIIGGLVIMELTLNHVFMLAQYSPELVKYADIKKHKESKLIVTHIILNSPIAFARAFNPGSLISEINEEKVGTLKQLRKVLQKSKKTGYLTIKTTENFFVALPIKEILDSEKRLAIANRYQITPGARDLLGIDRE